MNAHVPELINQGAAIDSLMAAMREQGIETQDSLRLDGVMERFHVEGDRKGSKNGWVIAHIDAAPSANFGSHKLYPGHTFRWKSNVKARPLSAAERKAEQEERARRKAAKAAAEAQRHTSAAERARVLWDAAVPAPADHPYLARKAISSHGVRLGVWEVINPDTGEVRVISDKALLVPMMDAKRKIWSLQAILPGKLMSGGSRDKDFLLGGRKDGLFSPIGSKPKQHEGRNVFVVCEGWATGASIYQATGHMTLVAFDAGNLLAVADALREKQADAVIVLAADHDQWTTKPISNPGRHYAKLAAASVKGLVAFPPFSAEAEGRPTDFNDLHVREGLEAVAERFSAALYNAHVPTEPELAVEVEIDLDDEPPAHVTEELPAAVAAAVEEAEWEEVVDANVPAFLQSVHFDQSLAVQGSKTAPDLPIGERPAMPAKRTIVIEAGDIPAAVDMAEVALVERCFDLYQRGGMLVRPAITRIDVADGSHVFGASLVRVGEYNLLERISRSADWEKLDARSGFPKRCDVPMVIAKTYMERVGEWRLRTLKAVINAPTLRSDGSIFETPGHDEATGLLFEPGLAVFPKVPESPTLEDAQAARDRLVGLIAEFPFERPEDKSVALSAMLTACVRRSLDTAPLHAFTAPSAGSGKSMLVDIASIIAIGHQAPAMNQARDEAEMEKRLDAKLIQGHQILTIDNCSEPLEGDKLCSILTQTTVEARPLGTSDIVTAPTTVAMFATGNSMVIKADMTRRVALCSLNPQCERPEDRVFRTDPKAMVTKNREQYLIDCLTILRAYHVAGRPFQVRPLGSFGTWSNWVRSALMWIGEVDPMLTLDKIRKNDPKREQINEVMAQWAEHIGVGKPATGREVIEKAAEQETSYTGARPGFLRPDFREALLNVAGKGGAISGRSLGKWLASNANAISNGMRFVKCVKRR